MPTILCEINPATSSLTKSYIYTDTGQIICQRNGGQSAVEYFYVTDRLGSVRQVIDNTGAVVANYTYTPFGQMLEESGSFDNSFLFTGQWFDSEFGQYYLRARMYDPVLMRFPARDPVKGKPEQPLTWHMYLYCLNNPTNLMDPSGENPWDWLSFDDYDWEFDGMSFEELLDIHNNMKNLPLPDINLATWSMDVAVMALAVSCDYFVPGFGSLINLTIWAVRAGPYLERIGYMNTLHNAMLFKLIDEYGEW